MRCVTDYLGRNDSETDCNRTKLYSSRALVENGVG